MTSTFVKASLGALALLATPFAAVAADVPVKGYYKSPPRSVISYYNWTGFYLGGVLGYGFGTSTLQPSGISTSPKGMMYGVTAGYNWQAGSFVYGIEGDYSFANVKGSATCVVGLGVCETSNTWLGTARGRLGYAMDRFLPYITGGAAFGNIKTNVSVGGVTANSDAATRMGWTLGGGLEYAFLSNWTVKAEYLYVDLGSYDSTALANTVSFKESIVRLGLNYKFNGPLFSRF